MEFIASNGESIIEIIKQKLSQHSFDVFLFVAGSFGALLSGDEDTEELNKKQRVTRVASGGVIAVFATQFIVELLIYLFDFELSQRASGAIGFFLGHYGMVGITKVMVAWTNRKKKK